MEDQIYLVNLHDGCIQNIFDDADQLIAYLKRKEEAGTLMSDAAFLIFLGKKLSTTHYWEKAFGKRKTS